MFYILLDFNQYRFVLVVHVQTSQIQAWNINTIQRVDSRGNGTVPLGLVSLLYIGTNYPSKTDHEAAIQVAGFVAEEVFRA